MHLSSFSEMHRLLQRALQVVVMSGQHDASEHDSADSVQSSASSVISSLDSLVTTLLAYTLRMQTPPAAAPQAASGLCRG